MESIASDELCRLVAGELFGMERTLVGVVAKLNAEHAGIGSAPDSAR